MAGEGQGSSALSLFLEDGGTAISAGRSVLQLPHGRCLYAGKGLAFVLNKCLQNLRGGGKKKKKSLQIWKKKSLFEVESDFVNRTTAPEMSAHLLCNGSQPSPITERCVLTELQLCVAAGGTTHLPAVLHPEQTHRSRCCLLNKKLKAPRVSAQQHWTRSSDALLLGGDAALTWWISVTAIPLLRGKNI